jgi:hypothetical protein
MVTNTGNPVHDCGGKRVDVPEVKEQGAFFADDSDQETGVSKGPVQQLMMKCRLHFRKDVL